MSLTIRPVAAAEIEHAKSWYDLRRPGLGAEFLDELADVVAVLLENPRRYRVVYRDVRRANLQRFPYGVLYRIVDQDVVVLACFHGSRDPRRWQGRG